MEKIYKVFQTDQRSIFILTLLPWERPARTTYDPPINRQLTCRGWGCSVEDKSHVVVL